MPMQPPRPHWITKDRAATCRSILTALPAWFARPQAIDEYCRLSNDLPMLGVTEGDDVLGFAALRGATSATTEVLVMGVRPEARRLGIGRAIVAEAVRFARTRGHALLSVQTVGPSCSDPHYDETRSFYMATGFLPVGEFADHWGPGMPMLLMVRSVS